MYLNIAAVLASLIGLGCALGGYTLRKGKPERWVDVTANDTVVKRTSLGLAALSVLLFTTAAMAITEVPFGTMALAATTLVFVGVGFWGNYALFGDLRPKHTGPNCLLAAVILSLLWFG